MENKEWLVDVPVLLIFFRRPDTFAEVFEKVREARPSKLFLACDGPREGTDDKEKIELCKRIAENIDWHCEVHRRYLDKNVGCGVGPQSAISWALSIEDRIVILEDDCVPDVSFFGYMAELLERYKDDERIGMISGLNHFREWECCRYSYFFAKVGAIWGWGTWRRVWEKYDYQVSAINDPYIQELLANEITLKRARKPKINVWKNANKKLSQMENISYWDLQFGFLKFYQSYLSIVPKHNLVCNIGIGEGSTHATTVAIKQWSIGSLHFIPTKRMEFPLIHPEFVICDRKYDNAVDARFGYPHPLLKQIIRGKRFVKRLFTKE